MKIKKHRGVSVFRNFGLLKMTSYRRNLQLFDRGLGLFFGGVLYFGWPSRPSSGTMENLTSARAFHCSRYLRNTRNTQK